MNAITALAHYEAMAEQARAVNFSRTAALLSHAQPGPTPEELHTLIGALCVLAGNVAARTDEPRDRIISETLDAARAISKPLPEPQPVPEVKAVDLLMRAEHALMRATNRDTQTRELLNGISAYLDRSGVAA